MKSSTIIFGAALALMLIYPATAEPARPADVRSGIVSLAGDCKSFRELRGFETNVDLNSDGVKDYILDFEHTDCDGGAGTFCGSAGCQLQILLSKGDRFVAAYGLAVREHSLQKKNGRYLMRMVEHGSYCGRAGVDECIGTYKFVGTKMRKTH